MNKDELQNLDSEQVKQVSGGRYHGWGPYGWRPGPAYWGGGWNARQWNSYATAMAMASLYNAYNSGPNVYYVY